MKLEREREGGRARLYRAVSVENLCERDQDGIRSIPRIPPISIAVSLSLFPLSLSVSLQFSRARAIAIRVAANCKNGRGNTAHRCCQLRFAEIAVLSTPPPALDVAQLSAELSFLRFSFFG